MRKLLSTLLFLVFPISISIVIYAYAEGDYSIENTILEVYEDEFVQVTCIIKVDIIDLTNKIREIAIGDNVSWLY